MHNKTISQLVQGLKKKDFSCTEIINHYLERIKQFNPKLNCFITLTEEQAIAQAKIADNLLATGIDQPPLTGIPIAYKDNFYTYGIKTTCASKVLKNFIAPYDATIVARLKKAGCINLGKSNMDEFAMGVTNETSYYGAVRNPWHLDKIPGGSSGGSAATVAARLAPCAIGTDTGGSVRQPSAICGVTGLKPTYGLLSRYGIVPLAPSLDQAGILATTAEDLGLLLQHCAGHDSHDFSSLSTSPPNYNQNITDSIAGLKIAIPQECDKHFYDQNNQEKLQLYDDVIKALEALGAKISTISLPHSPLAMPTYDVLATAECTKSLACYDNALPDSHHINHKDKTDTRLLSRNEAFGAEVKRRLVAGFHVLSAQNYATIYQRALDGRRLITNDFITAYKDVDLILTPTTPIDACFIGEKGTNSEHPINKCLSDIYTSLANLAGLPAISFPVGFVNKMPVGMQLIGSPLSEAKLLNVVHKYQQTTPWHTVIPSGF